MVRHAVHEVIPLMSCNMTICCMVTAASDRYHCIVQGLRRRAAKLGRRLESSKQAFEEPASIQALLASDPAARALLERLTTKVAAVQSCCSREEVRASCCASLSVLSFHFLLFAPPALTSLTSFEAGAQMSILSRLHTIDLIPTLAYPEPCTDVSWLMQWHYHSFAVAPLISCINHPAYLVTWYSLFACISLPLRLLGLGQPHPHDGDLNGSHPPHAHLHLQEYAAVAAIAANVDSELASRRPQPKVGAKPQPLNSDSSNSTSASRGVNTRPASSSTNSNAVATGGGTNASAASNRKGNSSSEPASTFRDVASSAPGTNGGAHANAAAISGARAAGGAASNEPPAAVSSSGGPQKRPAVAYSDAVRHAARCSGFLELLLVQCCLAAGLNTKALPASQQCRLLATAVQVSSECTAVTCIS